MTWSYLPQLLTSTTAAGGLMKVRLLIGDTEVTRQQLQDEEIYYILSAESVITYAAASACDVLAAKYAFLVNTDNSALRVSAAARHKHYITLADRLRSMGPGDIPGGAGAGVVLSEVYVGGASHEQANNILNDSNNKTIPFSVGQDDFPENH
jgi:hypothetical protein